MRRIKRVPPPAHKPNIGDCWEWTGGKVYGYGAFSVGRKNYRAHRWIYEHYEGEIEENLNICHICDNRSCCNPNHLFKATQQENITDCINKKRFNVAKGQNSGSAKHPETHQGEKHGMAKLTNELVYRIRELATSPKLDKEIANSFGVTRETIRNIRIRRTWKHLPQPNPSAL